MSAVLAHGAAASIVAGPFLAASDGATPLPALPILQADVLLSKNGAAPAAKADAAAAVALGGGFYSIPLSAADTSDAGVLSAVILAAGAIPVRVDAQVVSAAVFGALYRTGASGWPFLGSGARSVEVTVQSGGAALEGAMVRVTKGSETYVGPTGASGQLTFSIDDGTWDVAIAAPGYSFAPAELEVSGDAEVSYAAELVAQVSPADPDFGVLYVYTADIVGRVKAGVLMSARLVGSPAKGGKVLRTATARARTDEEGYAALELVRNDAISVPEDTCYTVDIPDLGIRELEVTVAAASVNVADLIG